MIFPLFFFFYAVVAPRSMLFFMLWEGGQKEWPAPRSHLPSEWHTPPVSSMWPAPLLWVSVCPCPKLGALAILPPPSGALRVTHILSVLLWLGDNCSGLLRSSSYQVMKYKTVVSILTLFSPVLLWRSDLRHVDWVRSYLNIWNELQAYIKEHHTTGLTWSKTVSTKHSLTRVSKALRILVKMYIPCGLRIYHKIGQKLYGNSISFRILC